MMELTVLGCYGPYPQAGGACSGYLLREEGCRVLIDCGNGVLSRLQEYLKFWELDAVVVSHLHSDHFADLLVMRYGLDYAQSSGRRSGPLPLYAPPQPEEDLRRLAYKNAYALTPLSAGQPLQIGPFKFDFLEAVHALPCLAMRVTSISGTLVYTGDTEYFAGLAPFAAGAGLLLCEANFQNADMAANPPNHLSAAQAGAVAAAAGARKLVLTHLHPERDAALSVAEAREHFAAAEAAREGITWRI
jgi:ribonuclease BN (tRNA processing enzyme)